MAAYESFRWALVVIVAFLIFCPVCTCCCSIICCCFVREIYIYYRFLRDWREVILSTNRPEFSLKNLRSTKIQSQLLTPQRSHKKVRNKPIVTTMIASQSWRRGRKQGKRQSIVVVQMKSLLLNCQGSVQPKSLMQHR